MSISERQRRFRDLHAAGCFVIPNPWDIGSAVILEQSGFAALATTSAGFSWSKGRPDYGTNRDEVLEHVRSIVGATAIPVSADFANGYADDPGGVAANVDLALKTGVAGLSIEDSTGDSTNPLYGFDHSVARVSAAKAAIQQSNSGALLTARADAFFIGRPDFDDTLRRLQAFAAAGADCLFAPGVRDHEQIKQIVEAVHPLPVNVLTYNDSVATLASLGVRRISVGGALTCAAYGELFRVIEEITSAGTFTAFHRAVKGTKLNSLFQTHQQHSNQLPSQLEK